MCKFKKDDRVKVTSENQHSPHEGRTGVIIEVETESLLYTVQFAVGDEDQIAEDDLSYETPPAPENRAVVHDSFSLVPDYGSGDEDNQSQTTTSTTTATTSSTTTTATTTSTATADEWRRDDTLNAWFCQGFYIYDDGRCFDTQKQISYLHYQDDVYYTSDAYFRWNPSNARDNWMVPYVAPAESTMITTTSTASGTYDQRTGKTFYPRGDGTFVDDDNNSYFYDAGRRRYEPLTTVQAPAPQATVQPAQTYQARYAEPRSVQPKRRRLAYDAEPATTTSTGLGRSASTPRTPSSTPRPPSSTPRPSAEMPRATTPAPSFVQDGLSFTLEVRPGGRSDLLGPSATRHGAEYQQSVARGTQGLREVMYNVPVYSETEYQNQLQNACVAAVTECRNNPGKYGQMLEVLDGNNRPWKIILVRGSAPSSFLVRHAHLENYQNQ